MCDHRWVKFISAATFVRVLRYDARRNPWAWYVCAKCLEMYTQYPGDPQKYQHPMDTVPRLMKRIYGLVREVRRENDHRA